MNLRLRLDFTKRNRFSRFLIRRIRHALLFQPPYQPIQRLAPEAAEQLCVAEAADKCRTDGIVDVDERTAGSRLFQCIVAESAQRPYLRAVIGTVDAGGDIAAVRTVGIGVSASKELGVA